ncbi:hypothetical protein PENTCL1PPCAC_6970, partial [Pristionchus entomophagus]
NMVMMLKLIELGNHQVHIRDSFTFRKSLQQFQFIPMVIISYSPLLITHRLCSTSDNLSCRH